MRRLLIAAALALTSCAPLLSAVQGDGATLTRSAGSVLFTNPGKGAAQDVAVFLSGAALTVTGADCRLIGSGIGCKLGDVPEGKSYRLIVVGSPTSGSATFYRPGSDRPVLTTLKGE